MCSGLTHARTHTHTHTHLPIKTHSVLELVSICKLDILCPLANDSDHFTITIKTYLFEPICIPIRECNLATGQMILALCQTAVNQANTHIHWLRQIHHMYGISITHHYFTIDHSCQHRSKYVRTSTENIPWNFRKFMLFSDVFSI